MTTRRMVLRKLALVPLAAMWADAAWAEAGGADLEQAQVLIGRLADQAIAVLAEPGLNLEAREERLRVLLKDGFDLDFLARFALGRHWRLATPDQQEDYAGLFADYIQRTYACRLRTYSGETLRIGGARAAGERDVLVRTTIQRSGAEPIVADWRVRPGESGGRIVDIMVEGVSLAVAQRSEVDSVVGRDGIEGLIQALRARTQKIGTPAS